MTETSMPKTPLLHPPGGPEAQPAPKPRSPMETAMLVGDYVKACVLLVMWLFVGAVALAALYVGLRAMWFGIQLVTKALGV